MKRKIFLGFLTLSLVALTIVPSILSPKNIEAAVTCDFYAAPNVQSGQGNGTSESPWELQTALEKPARTLSGKTLCLKGGTYKGNFTYPTTSNPVSPFTVRSAPNEWAIIDSYLEGRSLTAIPRSEAWKPVACSLQFPTPIQRGALVSIEGESFNIDKIGDQVICTRRGAGLGGTVITSHPANAVAFTYGSALSINGSNSIWRNLEVVDSNWRRYLPSWYTGQTRGGGVDSRGIKNKFINLILHDAVGNIGLWKDSSGRPSDNEFFGNIVYNGGINSDDREHGHSLYIQNEVGSKWVKNNFFFNSFGYGIHGYSSSNAAGMEFEGNTVFGSGALGSGLTSNILMGGANPIFRKNYTAPARDISFDCQSSAIWEDNYFYENAIAVRCPFASFKRNTVIGDFRWNYEQNTTPPNPPVDSSNSFYKTSTPTQNRIFVNKANYSSSDPVKLYVTVYNWQNLDSVSLNLESYGFPRGNYEIRDVQNVHDYIATNQTYSGGNVTLPMNNAKIEPILAPSVIPTMASGKPAWKQPVHTGKNFQTFMICQGGCFNGLSGKITTSSVSQSATSDTVYPIIKGNLPVPSTKENYMKYTSPVSDKGYVTISGTASDTNGVREIVWGTDKGYYGVASGTTNWNANVPLKVGVNLIMVVVYDNAGNTNGMIYEVTSSVAANSIEAPTILPSTKFVVGEQVVTTTSLNVRSTASVNASQVVGSPVANNTIGTIIGGATPEQSGSTIYQWWQIRYNNGVTGWSVENYLSKYTPPEITPEPSEIAPSTKFVIGEKVVTKSDLHVRIQPSVNAPTVSGSPVKIGTQGTIIGGATPEQAGTTVYQWWKVKYDNGVSGWSVESAGGYEYLARSTTTTPPPPPPDTTAPTLSVTAPSAVSANSVTVSGNVFDDKGVDTFTSRLGSGNEVDRKSTIQTNGNFSFTVSNLQSGKNAITLTAKDATGNPKSAVVQVTYNPPVAVIPTSAASFVKTDTTTQGSWKSAYGAEGYLLAQGGQKVPTYITPTVIGGAAYTWASNTADIRALQNDLSGRTAATWYSSNSSSIKLDANDSQSHQIALYLLDWDSGGARQEKVEVIDTATGTVLDTQTVSNFTNGKYLVWNIQGSVTFKITRLSGSNAVISGIFFGGPSATVTPPPLTTATIISEPENGTVTTSLPQVITTLGGEIKNTASGITSDGSQVKQGEVSINFTVPSNMAPQNTFYFFGRKYSASGTNDDSWYYQFNNDNWQLWDVNETDTIYNGATLADFSNLNAWQWSRLGGRGQTGCQVNSQTNQVSDSTCSGGAGAYLPSYSNLVPGQTYTIKFRSRDLNARLDKLCITTSNDAKVCDGTVAGAQTYDFGFGTLRRGNVGPAVAELQKFLNASLNLDLPTEGTFGPRTETAVKLWQTQHGLVADGVVGPKTKVLMR